MPRPDRHRTAPPARGRLNLVYAQRSRGRGDQRKACTSSALAWLHDASCRDLGRWRDCGGFCCDADRPGFDRPLHRLRGDCGGWFAADAAARRAKPTGRGTLVRAGAVGDRGCAAGRCGLGSDLRGRVYRLGHAGCGCDVGRAGYSGLAQAKTSDQPRSPVALLAPLLLRATSFCPCTPSGTVRFVVLSRRCDS